MLSASLLLLVQAVVMIFIIIGYCYTLAVAANNWFRTLIILGIFLLIDEVFNCLGLTLEGIRNANLVVRFI